MNDKRHVRNTCRFFKQFIVQFRLSVIKAMSCTNRNSKKINISVFKKFFNIFYIRNSSLCTRNAIFNTSYMTDFRFNQYIVFMCILTYFIC